MAHSFPSTLWSQVLAAGAGQQTALEQLAARYLTPVYQHVRRSGVEQQDAEDLTHEFFVHLIESQALARADPAQGRFRAYLYGCVSHFLRHQARRRRATKRGRNRRHVSIDIQGAEEALNLSVDDDPQRAFDQRWAMDLMSRGMQRLELELSERAARVFSLANGPAQLKHKEIAIRVGMREDAVAAALSRARKRLRRILLAEVRETVKDDRGVEAELGYLLAALSGR